MTALANLGQASWDMSLSNRQESNNGCILHTTETCEAPPMTAVGNEHTDVNELVNHIKSITTELTALHADLYWLAMQAQDVSGQQAAAGELNVELLTAFKGTVDNVRLLLWNYIETASQVDPQKVEAGLERQRMQRMTQFLRLLRERLGRSSDQQPLSFIERISAAMKERLGKERLGNKVA